MGSDSPLFSIVTISFNQVDFVERAIRSVVEQDYPNMEYIVVDPGSTDGSREIIKRYQAHIDRLIFEHDDGAADGLNKGFAKASGVYYGYLNSDDELLPGALSEAANHLTNNPNVDVVCGHSWIVDNTGKKVRKSFSDRVNLRRKAYNASIQMQASTFFRSEIFQKVRGFNVENRVAWDDELLIDMTHAGAVIRIIDRFWSLYRVHENNITGGASHAHTQAVREYRKHRFIKTLGRQPGVLDAPAKYLYLAAKYFENPKALQERLLRGPIYRNGSN